MSADASSEFLTFRLGAEEYAIDVLQVREIRALEPVTAIAGAPAFLRGVIHLRGDVVPVIDLRAKLAMPERTASGVTIILLLAGRFVGVMVDGVNDVARLEPRDIRPAPEVGSALARKFIHGIAPIEGRMLVVLDLERLLVDDDLRASAPEAA